MGKRKEKNNAGFVLPLGLFFGYLLVAFPPPQKKTPYVCTGCSCSNIYAATYIISMKLRSTQGYVFFVCFVVRSFPTVCLYSRFQDVQYIYRRGEGGGGWHNLYVNKTNLPNVWQTRINLANSFFPQGFITRGGGK